MTPAHEPPPQDVADAVVAAVARLNGRPLNLHWLASTPSTMDVAKASAQAGAPEGLVVMADEQTAGRGRLGRSWSSPSGAGIYLSLALKPSLAIAPPTLSLLTLAAGVAVREAIQSATGLPCDLKWPNDVMAHKRKIAGILAEAIGLHTSKQMLILGVGVNVRPGAYPLALTGRATAIEEELGQPVARGTLLTALLVALFQRYDALRGGHEDDILREWRRASPSAHGARVQWQGTEGTESGTTAGVDDAGALLINSASGVKRIVGGEVRWVDR